jgi:hypothetical protein
MNTMKNPITQSFMDGIAYLFGIGDNPIEAYYLERQKKNEGLSGWEIDARNIAGDWQRVGLDIQKAYEQETAKTDR